MNDHIEVNGVNVRTIAPSHEEEPDTDDGAGSTASYEETAADAASNGPSSYTEEEAIPASAPAAAPEDDGYSFPDFHPLPSGSPHRFPSSMN